MTYRTDAKFNNWSWNCQPSTINGNGPYNFEVPVKVLDVIQLPDELFNMTCKREPKARVEPFQPYDNHRIRQFATAYLQNRYMVIVAWFKWAWFWRVLEPRWSYGKRWVSWVLSIIWMTDLIGRIRSRRTLIRLQHWDIEKYRGCQTIIILISWCICVMGLIIQRFT